VNAAFHEQLARCLRQGRRVVVATLIDSSGSTPRKESAQMAVLEDGSILGSVGGGAFEALVVEEARALLATGGSAVREFVFREGDAPGDTGMVCGGRARVYLQVEVPPERLLIFGAGHVGRALASLATSLGFEITVVDDRPAFLDQGRFPPGVQAFRADPGFSGVLPPVDSSTYVAIVTRCHRTDLAALRRVIDSGAAYLGLIGSRRKVAVIRDRLRGEGVPEDLLGRIRGPIGIPIGACTPEEIAVSIAGELIRTRRGFEAAHGSASFPASRPAERHRTRPRPAREGG
jgi:xanthine dehydrogenase accessory factor